MSRKARRVVPRGTPQGRGGSITYERPWENS